MAALDLLAWGGAFLLAVFALWPAIWALGPAEILARVVQFARETGGQPHEQGTFFWGAPRTDPGPLFYPVALLFRLSPLAILGIGLLAFLWRCLPATRRGPVLVLALYCLGFGLMMTLGAKKFDRYVLPIVPALGVLAAVGLGLAAERLVARSTSRALPARASRAVGAGLGAAVVALAAWPAVAAYPYYLSYYNPLLGGGAAAQRTVMVGNGEGLDRAAAWLNARPDAADLYVVAHAFDILQPLIVGSGASLEDRVPRNADYVVLYRFQTQIGHSPRVVAEYATREPEHVVRINGIEYARIYRGPRRLAGAESPSISGVGR